MLININGVYYPVDKGNTITLNYNETLNSATVRISHLSERLNIEPFDEVFLIDGDIVDDAVVAKNRLTNAIGSNEIYFCVNNFQEQQISLDPIIYNYTISLFSQTKKLENYILPSLSITPHKLSTPLTIEEVIKQVLNLYGPRRKVRHRVYKPDGTLKETNIEWETTYTVAELPDTFKGLNYCPEMQWTTPTLRDVLNDLFMLRDCIVTLNNNVIGFLDITKTYDEITDYNFITRSRNSQDYATELKMNLQNLLQQGSEEHTNSTTTSEFLTFTSDSYIVNDQNLHLETQYPILRIRNLYVYWYTSVGTNDRDHARYIKVDLCKMRLANDIDNTVSPPRKKYYSFVKEKKEYDTLIADAFIGSTFGGMNAEISSLEEVSNYKNANLYYTRGSNIISGFSDLQKINLAHETILLKYILMFVEKAGLLEFYEEYENLSDLPSAVASAFEGQGSYGTIGNVMNTFFAPMFQVVYETTKEVVFAASKKELLHNERTIMDNQTNSWVNGEAQGRFEYQKANRTGNEEVMINQRTYNNPIKLGDYLEDEEKYGVNASFYREIVYSVDYQIYDDFINVNAKAIKNYILRDYYTGINSRVRTWINAQDEAFIRHDLYKYYIEFSETPFIDTIVDCDIQLNTFLHPFYNELNYNNYKVNYVGIRTKQNDDYYPSPEIVNNFTVNKYYILNLVTRVLGNSLVFTYGFSDNYVALKRINTGEHEAGLPTSDPVLYDGVINVSDISAGRWVNRYAPPHVKHYVFDNLHNSFEDALSLFDIQSNDSRSAKEILVDISNNMQSILNRSENATLGGIPFNVFPYCNHDGNFETLEAIFFMNPTITINNGDDVSGPQDNYSNYWEALHSSIANVDIPMFTFKQKVYKDNKEIITSSIQFEFMSNTPKIEVYNSFAKNQKIIAIKQENSLYVYYFKENVFGIVPNSSVNINISPTYAYSQNSYHFVLEISDNEYDNAEYYVISNTLIADISEVEYKADIKTYVKDFYINFKQNRWIMGVVDGESILENWKMYLTNTTRLSLLANMEGNGPDSAFHFAGLLLSNAQKSVEINREGNIYYVKLGSAQQGSTEDDYFKYDIDKRTHRIGQPNGFSFLPPVNNEKKYNIIQDYYSNVPQEYKGLLYTSIRVVATRIQMYSNVVSFEFYVPNDFSLNWYSSSTSYPAYQIIYSGYVYDTDLQTTTLVSSQQVQLAVFSTNQTEIALKNYTIEEDPQRNLKKMTVTFDGTVGYDADIRNSGQVEHTLYIQNMYFHMPVIKLEEDN